MIADSISSALPVSGAEISYVVRAMPLPVFAPELANFPVPLDVSGVLSASLLGGLGLVGLARLGSRPAARRRG